MQIGSNTAGQVTKIFFYFHLLRLLKIQILEPNLRCNEPDYVVVEDV